MDIEIFVKESSKEEEIFNRGSVSQQYQLLEQAFTP